MSKALVEHYRSLSRAANTERGYASDWREFSEWCQRRSVAALPAEALVVAEYLAELAGSDGAKRNTIQRRAAAINARHEEAGHARPGAQSLVREVLRGIKRSKRDEELDQAAPLTRELLVVCLDALEAAGLSELRVARDRALLVIGFAAALRRSEIVSMRVRDLHELPEGLVLTIPVSKTDQEGAGHEVGMVRTNDTRLDPVSAWRVWLECSMVASGPLLRSVSRHGKLGERGLDAGSVNRIVKQAVARTGMPLAEVEAYSGHSMRAGFVTSARAAGVADHVIMRTTRHKDARTLGIYARGSDFFATVHRLAGW